MIGGWGKRGTINPISNCANLYSVFLDLEVAREVLPIHKVQRDQNICNLVVLITIRLVDKSKLLHDCICNRKNDGKKTVLIN